MNFSEALSFTGKCLTLGMLPERISEIRETIRNGSVEWEKIVKLSSGHLVLPALFIQLQRAELLNELPDDLTEYMDFLTQQNRKRNKQIINQVQDISSVLNNSGINPIYLKGVANLLLPLYDDIAERMVGDIDFLVDESEMLRTVNLLIQEGYTPMAKYYPEMLRSLKHYPRLANYDYPAAVEVHIRVVRPPHDRKFSFSDINQNKQRIPGSLTMYVPSNRHLIIHNALNAQVNDKAYLWGNPMVRQMYDLLLLSNFEEPTTVLKEFPFYQHKTNTWLAMTSRVFDYPAKISFRKSWQTWLQLIPFCFLRMNNRFLFNIYRTVVYIVPRISRYLTLPIKAIYKKDVRKGLRMRLSDPKWYGKHFDSYRRFFGKLE